MSNELIIIDSLIQQHEAIQGHMKSVICLVDEWKEIDWGDLPNLDHEQLQILNEKHMNFKQTMGYLADGLKNHHQHEEETMPKLIGDNLMEAIRIEHNEMHKQLGEVNFILINVTPQGFLSNRPYLNLVIDNLLRLIKEHSNVENMILHLLKRRFI
jgi:hypothetical protein